MGALVGINIHIAFSRKSSMRMNIHTEPFRALFILQCLEEIKDTSIHSKILPFIILNILRNRHML